MVKCGTKMLVRVVIFVAVFFTAASSYSQDDDSTRNVLKQGLLGAGTGAIAAGASGGNAGKGALIGAGTNVIGSALLDAMTAPPASSRSRRSAPPPDDYYYDDSDQSVEYYEEPPQESGTQKILKQGLVGAGSGALAAGMSGGNAGQGALIGAGTNVIGSALLDTITQPAPQRRGRVYKRAAPPPAPVAQNTRIQTENVSTDTERKKVIKKYDANGKLVSEEEIYY